MNALSWLTALLMSQVPLPTNALDLAPIVSGAASRLPEAASNSPPSAPGRTGKKPVAGSVTEPPIRTNTLSRPMELGTELEVLEVRFEPLTVGKNVVYLKVRNRLASRHTLGVDLRASSPTPSGRASAWQTQYFLELAPGATVPARFPFKLQSPLADD